MRCEVCGLDYGLTHNCAGAAAAQMTAAADAAADAAQQVPETQRNIFHYLKEGWRVATWDDRAICRCSQDSRSTGFGLSFLVVSLWIVYLFQVAWVAAQGGPLNLVSVFAQGMVLSSIQGASWIFILLLCHVIVRLLLHGRARFIEVLRPTLLASFLLVLMIAPVIGSWVASAWFGTGVTLSVFEELHGVERLRTLLVVVIVNVGLIFLGLSVAGWVADR